MFRYYRSYEDFIKAFPRFKSSLISFNLLKSRIPKIINWFESDECKALSTDDVTSSSFWKIEGPSIFPSILKPVVGLENYEKDITDDDGKIFFNKRTGQ